MYLCIDILQPSPIILYNFPFFNILFFNASISGTVPPPYFPQLPLEFVPANVCAFAPKNAP